MKKICRDNSNFESMLTKGKDYEILEEVGNQYLVEANNGNLFYIDSKRFE